jgi:hypothetical protein
VATDRDPIEAIMLALQQKEVETRGSAPIHQETFQNAAEITQWHDNFSLSVFVIDVDAKPVLAFAAKKYTDAEFIYRDARLRSRLRSLKSGGNPLSDDLAILRLRLASPLNELLTVITRSPRKAKTGSPIWSKWMKACE